MVPVMMSAFSCSIRSMSVGQRPVNEVADRAGWSFALLQLVLLGVGDMIISAAMGRFWR
jgi:hypothetical protein